jgi:uncharacterized repeat protein (TIGR01451 family)
LFAGQQANGIQCPATNPPTPVFSEACTITPSPQPANACATLGKPQTLTLQFTGGSCTSGNSPQSGKFTCTGTVNPAATNLTLVSLDGDPVTPGPGNTFVVQGPFGAQTDFTLTGPGTNAALSIHTSCSQRLEVGEVFGPLTLVGFNNQGGPGGTTVRYRFTVRNTGAVGLTNVTLIDTILGQVGIVTSRSVLAPRDVRSGFDERHADDNRRCLGDGYSCLRTAVRGHGFGDRHGDAAAITSGGRAHGNIWSITRGYRSQAQFQAELRRRPAGAELEIDLNDVTIGGQTFDHVKFKTNKDVAGSLPQNTCTPVPGVVPDEDNAPFNQIAGFTLGTLDHNIPGVFRADYVFRDGGKDIGDPNGDAGWWGIRQGTDPNGPIVATSGGSPTSLLRLDKSNHKAKPNAS